MHSWILSKCHKSLWTRRMLLWHTLQLRRLDQFQFPQTMVTALPMAAPPYLMLNQNVPPTQSHEKTRGCFVFSRLGNIYAQKKKSCMINDRCDIHSCLLMDQLGLAALSSYFGFFHNFVDSSVIVCYATKNNM